MTDRRLREDVARIVLNEATGFTPEEIAGIPFGADDWSIPFECADRILSIPAIRDALNFHQACLSRLEQGDFYVTKESMGSNGKHWGE